MERFALDVTLALLAIPLEDGDLVFVGGLDSTDGEEGSRDDLNH
jgi:hypothetical protein